MKSELVYDANYRNGDTIKLPLFLYRIFIYEYWPFWILFSPCVFYWIVLSIRARSFTWFTAANPGIKYGGVFGESKEDILKMVPENYLPVSLYIEQGNSFEEISMKIKEKSLSYPLICKPDKGEMGFMVERVMNENELKLYIERARQKFIIQEYINFPVELGILYHRLPGQTTGKVTSVVSKEFLAVNGDGISTIRELMEQSARARFQIERLSKQINLKSIPHKGEYILLEPIGNHCRGTRFINSSEIINAQLNQIFDLITKDMNGFYYGRFDLRVSSLDDLKNGRNIRIMEVNGVTSEPAHIYDSNMNLIKSYVSIFQHMKIIFNIASANNANGTSYVNPLTLYRSVSAHFKEKGM